MPATEQYFPRGGTEKPGAYKNLSEDDHLNATERATPKNKQQQKKKQVKMMIIF